MPQGFYLHVDVLWHFAVTIHLSWIATESSVPLMVLCPMQYMGLVAPSPLWQSLVLVKALTPTAFHILEPDCFLLLAPRD